MKEDSNDIHEGDCSVFKRVILVTYKTRLFKSNAIHTRDEDHFHFMVRILVHLLAYITLHYLKFLKYMLTLTTFILLNTPTLNLCMILSKLAIYGSKGFRP